MKKRIKKKRKEKKQKLNEGGFMKFIIIKFGKEEIEMELDERDPTLPSLLAYKINNYDNVYFCAYKWEHPLVDNPKFYLKAENSLKIFKKAIEEIRNEIKELKNNI
jgi:DNA-directed RNA polymerase subunit L